MTTFTMRYVKGHFVVTGPDGPPMQTYRSRTQQRVLESCSARRKSPTLVLARSMFLTRRTPANRAYNMPSAAAEAAGAAEDAEAAEDAGAAAVAAVAAAVSRRGPAASAKRPSFLKCKPAHCGASCFNGVGTIGA
jgi:hypothetical protein